MNNWACFKIEERDGKKTKVPRLTDRSNARPNDPSTWGSFEVCAAAAAASPGKFDGIGFMFTRTCWTIVDLDNCRDPETGHITAQAAAIITQLNSYSEVSQSGKGVHIIVRAALPPGRRRKGKVEMYGGNGEGASPRFLVMTGDHLPFTPTSIENRDAEVAAVHAKFLAEDPKTQPVPKLVTCAPVTTSDQEILKTAVLADSRFANLYYLGFEKGGRFPSQSEADLALVRMLLYWTGNDEARMGALFRGSALMREKWNRPDYRTRTIAEARKSPYRPPIDYCPSNFITPGEYILPGQRHNVLRGIAVRMGKLGFKKDDILVELERVNGRWASPPLAFTEIHHEIATWGERSPYTDEGNGQFFALKFGQETRWCEAEGKWMAWDGQRWTDAGKDAGIRAHSALNALYREADGLPEEQAKQALKWATRSASRARMEAMVATAKRFLPVQPDEFDCDQYLLCLANGVLSLRTGDLRSPRREDMLRLMSPVQFDANAKCPRWTQFVNEVFEPHPDLLPFIQRAIGYSLTGDIREHSMFILYGGGANGKSTMLAVLQTLLGEYSGTLAHSSLMAKDNNSMTNDWAKLRGKRFAVAQETREGAALDEAVVKSMTSGDRVSVRALYQDFFEMDPRFKIWLASNHLPKITGSDDAIWRRIKLIPFDVSFLGREDKTLVPTLMTELPGILNWAVEGCLAWQAQGLGTATAIEAATGGYKDASDVVRLWAAERCEFHGEFSSRGAQLYGDYKDWCTTRGEKAMTSTMFGRRVSGLAGVSKRHAATGAVYDGINLQPRGREE